MGNSDLCRNGPNCWFLWNSDCWYKHPWEEKKKVMELKREVKKALEEKKRAEENAIAEEAFTRIPNLPEELRLLILHHLQPTIIEKLELSVSTLRSVLQVIRESFSATGQISHQLFAGTRGDWQAGAGEVHVDRAGRVQRGVARLDQAGQESRPLARLPPGQALHL